MPRLDLTQLQNPYPSFSAVSTADIKFASERFNLWTRHWCLPIDKSKQILALCQWDNLCFPHQVICVHQFRDKICCIKTSWVGILGSPDVIANNCDQRFLKKTACKKMKIAREKIFYLVCSDTILNFLEFVDPFWILELVFVGGDYQNTDFLLVS